MIGVRFGTYHTWDDWGIIRENVIIPPPEPVRYTIEVPGRDGVLDVTGAVTPEIKFRTRDISFEFHVKKGSWTELLSHIMSEIHGRELQVIDDIDPDFYWNGFCRYDEFSSDEQIGHLVITLEADPYKLHRFETERKITGSGSLNCVNDRMTVIPVIENSASAEITLRNTTVTLSAGTHIVNNFRLKQGNNKMTITSTGTTKVRYRQGRL